MSGFRFAVCKFGGYMLECPHTVKEPDRLVWLIYEWMENLTGGSLVDCPHAVIWPKTPWQWRKNNG